MRSRGAQRRGLFRIIHQQPSPACWMSTLAMHALGGHTTRYITVRPRQTRETAVLAHAAPIHRIKPYVRTSYTRLSAFQTQRCSIDITKRHRQPRPPLWAIPAATGISVSRSVRRAAERRAENPWSAASRTRTWALCSTRDVSRRLSAMSRTRAHSSPLDPRRPFGTWLPQRRRHRLGRNYHAYDMVARMSLSFVKYGVQAVCVPRLQPRGA